MELFEERGNVTGKRKKKEILVYWILFWLEGANKEFKISIYQPCPFSLSGGSLPQGRSKNNFEDSSKKRRVKDLVKSPIATELTTAAEVANRLLGHKNLATLIRKSSELTEKIKSSEVILVAGN